MRCAHRLTKRKTWVKFHENDQRHQEIRRGHEIRGQIFWPWPVTLKLSLGSLVMCTAHCHTMSYASWKSIKGFRRYGADTKFNGKSFNLDLWPWPWVKVAGSCALHTVLLTVWTNHVITGFCRGCGGQIEDSIDADQLTSQKPADLDLHSFQSEICPRSAW